MSETVFKCRQCGKCCKENWEIIVDFNRDILRWIEEDRYDILKRIVLSPKYVLDPGFYGNKPYWIIDTGHVLFGDLSNNCPFLNEEDDEGRSGCIIHDTRPMICRKFPFDHEEELRSDILDLCVGSIFYYSKLADNEGIPLVDYMKEKQKEHLKRNAVLPIKKDELKVIAHGYCKSDLKISLTSDIGLDLAEENIHQL